MSDNIPFEIQSEIIKRFPVKSLLQFRSVSKPWKSLIDSSDFIKHHISQHTQTQRLLVSYDDPAADSKKQYVSIADDDTFPQQKVSYSFPLLANLLKFSSIIGTSHGLVCLYGCDSTLDKDMAVIFNPSVKKAAAVVVPNLPSGTTYGIVVGFGVCRETTEPKIVKITYIMDWDDMESITTIPCQVELFALSTGAWRRPYNNNPPRRSICFNMDSVLIDGVLYWLAMDGFNTPDGYNYYNLIVSFDLTTEEFGEIYLPDSLASVDEYNLSISKLRNSLVVLRSFADDKGFTVWVMLVDDDFPQSFIRIFTVISPDLLVKGFRKNGEIIIEMVQHQPGQRDGSFFVAYDPDSKNLTNLEIDVFARLFCVFPYVETLLLLDQPDFVIYDQGKATLQSGEPREESKSQ